MLVYTIESLDLCLNDFSLDLVFDVTSVSIEIGSFKIYKI